MAKLKRIKMTDVETYHLLSKSSDDIRRWLPSLVGNSKSETYRIVEDLANCDFKKRFAFFVCNENWNPVGVIYACQEEIFNSLNVSCFICPEYRRNGYMYDAMQLFISYCTNSTPYRSLYFDIMRNNTNSKRLSKKLKAKFVYRYSYDEITYFERYELVLR